MPENFSNQKEHSFAYETSFRQAWSWCREIWQNLVYMQVTQNSIHRKKN